MLTKTYDLLLWYVGHIGRFPKQHRYSLGQRIEKQLYKVLECLTVARYERANRRHLEKANLRLELLRIQTRLARDLQCLKGSSSPGRALNSRVLRGGSFNNNATNMRSANRNNNRPDNRNNNNGFRVSSTLTVVCQDHNAGIQGRDLISQVSR